MSLFILAFDHRSSFSKKLLGFTGKLSEREHARVRSLKRMVFEGAVLAQKRLSAPMGVLIDEEHGLQLLKSAKKKGFISACPAEKSGQKHFAFEYGNAYGKHIEKVGCDFVKVLVRYHPKEDNTTQLARLERLSKYCQKHGHRLLFELLVPPREQDLKSAKRYDTLLRGTYTLQAVKEINRRVHVDVWKIEWQTKETYQKLIAHLGEKTRIVLLGRGEDALHVERRMRVAAQFEQIIGFAIGRTIFDKPLRLYLEKRINRMTAVSRIARNYTRFIRVWKREKEKYSRKRR